MKRYFLSPGAAVVTFLIGVTISAAACFHTPVTTSGADVPAVPESPGNMSSQPIDRSVESYKIYSVILAGKWSKSNLVVRDTTDRGMFQNDDWLEQNLGKSNLDAVNDFKAANEKSIQLENRFDYDGKLVLISQANFKKTIGEDGGWDQFKKAYPGATGIVSFSAVGFDRTGGRALVNVAYLCGGHCGDGTFFVLEKKNGEWAISKELGTWIS
jgi:hypothetical protein